MALSISVGGGWMRFLFGLLLLPALVSSGAWSAEPRYPTDRPCLDQDFRVRPPLPNEYCDYVQQLKTCDGDLTERLFRQRRQPAYLIPELGSEHPRRFVCHQD